MSMLCLTYRAIFFKLLNASGEDILWYFQIKTDKTRLFFSIPDDDKRERLLCANSTDASNTSEAYIVLIFSLRKYLKNSRHITAAAARIAYAEGFCLIDMF
jgi:hypothetical protein